MNSESIIPYVEKFVRENLAGHDGGHDWWHIDRVRKLALGICLSEGNDDPLVVELASLLHDIGDSKFNGGDREELLMKADQLLAGLGADEKSRNEILFINRNISFSKGGKPAGTSAVFDIVQDADRLDAMGAVGIARAFNYGGFRNNPIYDPAGEVPSTIAHFHEKLLKLKDLMNTRTGRRLAGERHRYMETFLERFYKDWNCL